MSSKQKIGLALGSGGLRGFAHIGVIKALVESDIKIDVITGTSSGAVIGGFYALTKDIKWVEDIFMNLKLNDLATFSDVALRSGIIKGNNMESFLDRYFNDANIENLDIKFAAIATDIRTTKDIIFSKGSLTKAVRASSSLPGFIDMFHDNGSYLIDGGISQPVPIRAARELGADKVIAINLDDYNYRKFEFSSKTKATTVVQASLKLIRYRLGQELCSEADWVIEPDVSDIINWSSLRYREKRIKAIDMGYQAAMEKIKAIKLDISLF
ncbi:patatin-like phospholipase family protein [Candidatus Woesebacteria bacterium]|nr:patatin-like phospholipase family protein [Candidatus Woesebacteria bacterium]